MKNTENSQFVSVGHIRDTLGVSYMTAMKIAISLPHIKVSERGLIRVSKKAFEEFITPKVGD